MFSETLAATTAHTLILARTHTHTHTHTLVKSAGALAGPVGG